MSRRFSSFGWSVLALAPAYFGLHCVQAARRGGEAGIVYGWFAVMFAALAIGCLLAAWRAERGN